MAYFVDSEFNRRGLLAGVQWPGLEFEMSCLQAVVFRLV